MHCHVSILLAFSGFSLVGKTSLKEFRVDIFFLYHDHFVLSAVFHVNLDHPVPFGSSCTDTGREPFWISGTGFYGLDVLPVSQATMSNH